MSTTLRDRLRAETEQDHARVDAAFAKLDLRRSDDLSVFFRANLAALREMTFVAVPGRDRAEVLRAEMAEALEADIAQLGAAHATAPAPIRVEPRAALYILLGSRAGTAVLRTQWRRAQSAAVLSADRYFSLDARRPAWRALCDELERSAATGGEADSVVADARRLFALYHDSLVTQAALPAHV